MGVAPVTASASVFAGSRLIDTVSKCRVSKDELFQMPSRTGM